MYEGDASYEELLPPSWDFGGYRSAISGRYISRFQRSISLAYTNQSRPIFIDLMALLFAARCIVFRATPARLAASGTGIRSFKSCSIVIPMSYIVKLTV